MQNKGAMIFKRTKILATVGPAVHDEKTIEDMARAGVNGFRLNCSHGTNDERVDQIAMVRKASEAVGKPVTILQDLQGPKIRLGMLNNDVSVKTGDELTLVYGKEHNGDVLPMQYNLAEKMKPGERLYIFDGKVRATVTDVAENTVKIRIENNGVLMSRKGINVPDTDFSGDILTEKDLVDLEWGIDKDIDYVALSFVQSADDMEYIKKLLAEKGSQAKVIAKIETKAAIELDVLEQIVKASDGVMVARGDLAVEAGAEVVPIVQRHIIALCQKYEKLSIVATQMMASMVDNPEPTRAEVSDVANAAILGADTVMLSEETAMGSYPVETIMQMKKVLMYVQEQEPAPTIFHRLDYRDMQDAISSAAVTLASQVGAHAIVAETKSGATATSIASHRPAMPIISVTSDKRVAQQLALRYANKSFLRPDGEKTGLSLARELKQQNYFGDGDGPTTVVIVSGRQPGMTGGTDTIRVRVLEKEQ